MKKYKMTVKKCMSFIAVTLICILPLTNELTFAAADNAQEASIVPFAEPNMSGNTISQNTSVISDNHVEEYLIQYVLYGGINNANNPSVYTVSSNDLTLKKPTKTGYTFDGWYRDASFSDEGKVEKLVKGSSGNIELHAKWTPKNYSITYYLNGGTNNKENPTSYTIETANITLKKPTKKGYTFEGWYKDAGLSAAKKVTQIKKGSSGSVKLYASWKLREYTITYTLNGGTNDVTNPQAYTTGTVITLRAPTREGYTFDGWYTSSSYQTKITEISASSAKNYNLYAKWTQNKPVLHKTPVVADDMSRVTTKASRTAKLVQLGATAKKTVTVPSSVKVDGVLYRITAIDACAFQKCKSAKTVILPQTVKTIKARAFAKSNLKTVRLTVPRDGKLRIAKKAFGGSKVKQVRLTLHKKASKKQKNVVLRALLRAGIRKENIRISMKNFY